MKRLNKFLTERKGEKAHREAEQMGLKYKGFGYWVDPRTGKVTHKTEGDELIQVEPDVETDKWEGGGDASASGRPGPAGSNAMGMPNMGGLGMQQTVPGAGVGQAPEPGLETIQARLSWDPGPDGDTCVDSANPKPDVPDDTFVGKTNYYQWTAGPDGTNYLNLSFDTFMQSVTPDMPAPQVEAFDYSMESPAAKAKQMGLTSDGHGYWLDQQGQAQYKTVGLQLVPLSDGEREDYSAEKNKQSIMRPQGKFTQKNLPGMETMERPGAKTMAKNVLQPGRIPKDWTGRNARSAFNKMRPMQQDAEAEDMMNIVNQGKRYPGQDTFDNDEDKRNQMWRKQLKMPAKQKDAEAVEEMNRAIEGFASDPLYDLDQFDDDEFMEGGAFGQVKVDGDTIVKRGQVGPDEMKALYAMRDNKAFPTLINGRFDGPFKHKSSYENNPMGADDDKREPGKSAYFEPDEQSEFEDMFPVAPGTYAMSRAKGKEAFDVMESLDPKNTEKAMKNFWRARGQFHMAGFSHNDMHGGNIFVTAEGEVTIIDLGLAKDNPVSALMEALGGLDYENQEDYQLTHHFSGASLPDEMREIMDDNRAELEEILMEEISDNPADYEDWDADSDYSPTKVAQEDALERIMRGGIRLKKEEIEELQENFEILQDEKEVIKLIRGLYKGIATSDLEDRMSKAFDKRQNDSKMIKFANEIRAKRGSKPISVRNPNVVPPENMDFDD